MTVLNTQTFKPDPKGLLQAADALRDGGLVAFPTETVYGLGADAQNDTAAAKIYAAKDRPKFNPLIAHFADVAQAKCHVQWSDAADQLTEAFWPGPLTLVLERLDTSNLSLLLSAGLPSLAIRVPAHPIAKQLLANLGGPIAAPSANLSGQISPTRSEHVHADLFGRIDGIVDGGDCQVGLESTIIDLTGLPTLLRPGGIPTEIIEKILSTRLAIAQGSDGIKAPGQLASHYAPRATLRLNANKAGPNETMLGFGPVECDLNLSTTSDLTEAAGNLFSSLHTLDQNQDITIAVSPIPKTGLGMAINDRLRRAAAPKPADK
jgi:L-threonylcarbamoyladenylate synthase